MTGSTGNLFKDEKKFMNKQNDDRERYLKVTYANQKKSETSELL